MKWIVFSYSLPQKSSSTARVNTWRRLQRLGAIVPKTGLYVLPDREDCAEAFQWLCQEIQQATGEAMVMHVEQFEGLSDVQLIELFRKARQEEYEEIGKQFEELEQAIQKKKKSEDPSSFLETVEKLRKRFSEVNRIDFFDCPNATQLTTQFLRIEQALNHDKQHSEEIPSAPIAQYQEKSWLTRPRPHVDRLACIWLIRRFIDADAEIRYANEIEAGEIAFDMKGAQFGHQGNFCSLETMMATFQLSDPGLQGIAEIVHEIDLRDGVYLRPETEGVATVLKGWLLAGLSDIELETHGIRFFDGLYAAFSQKQTVSSEMSSSFRKKKKKA